MKPNTGTRTRHPGKLEKAAARQINRLARFINDVAVLIKVRSRMKELKRRRPPV